MAEYEDLHELSDDEIISLLRKEENAASNYQWSALAQTREDSLNYYDREPYGDEQEGASQVVTSEFADSIESIMPSLMRVFTATDDVCEFTPAQPGEEKWAKEASDYVPFVFMKQNDGFRILYWLIKDALMYRLGAVTVDLEPYEDVKKKTVKGISKDAVDLIVAAAKQQDAEIDVDDLTQDNAEGSPGQSNEIAHGPTFSGTIVVTHKRQRVKAENIAPEDILFTPTARDQDKASFLGFRKRATASDLRLLGISEDDIQQLRSDRDLSFEDTQRNDSAVVNEQERDDLTDSERPMWLVVAYMRADYNGDGISEMKRILYAHAGGTASTIIEQVDWEGPASMVLATPILMSHVIIGRSLFDQTQDLQQIGSVLTRGYLDNLYLTNRPRPVISDQVNLDSLIDWVPGSPIRLKAGARPGDGHVTWLQVPDISQGVLGALEYFQTVKENRLGITRHNQGLESDSLNKTASGMSMMMSAAAERQELVAKTIAETAIKRLYRLLYRRIKEAASGPIKYWTGKDFAGCDPTQWPDDMDVSVDVGAGTKDKATQQLVLVGTLMDKIVLLQGGTANGPYVTPENVANFCQKSVETVGFKSPGMFFQPPDAVMQAVQKQAQQPPPPDPKIQIEQLKVQGENAKAQGQIQVAQLQAQTQQQKVMSDSTDNQGRFHLEQAKAQADSAAKQRELDLREREIALTHEREVAKIQLAHEAKLHEIGVKAQAVKVKADAKPAPNGHA